MDVALHHTVAVCAFDRSVGTRLVNFGAGIIEALEKWPDIHIYEVVDYREYHSVNDGLFRQGSSWWNTEMDARNKQHK